MERSAFYAHSPNDRGKWHELRTHLDGVAQRARGFGEKFGAGEWAWTAGMWHDLGKFSDAFQRYLASSAGLDLHQAEVQGKVDHATAGAQHAVASVGIAGHLLAYVISGHHSGLLDARAEGQCLEARLQKEIEDWGHGPLTDVDTGPPDLPHFVREAIASRAAFTVGFFVRMLYSCLVDADFLDTEQHFDSDRSASRPIWSDGILLEMADALDEYVKKLHMAADPSEVNRARADVHRACIEAATQARGLFSLTVPTGGGKTLSSLAFALAHAQQHRLERVIYVIPFTSIIEQNADVFRRVMAPLMARCLPDPVLEHHSAIEVDNETVASRLAAENWAAPLVVTTSVQFYESLFANRSSRCRKLHNIVRSVIVLDEAQTIPVEYLDPCLRALHELVTNYSASVVLCTATQPAVHHREGFPIGLKGVREIVADPAHLYLGLRRTTVHNLGSIEDEQLASELRQHSQVLCIVNTRSHARKLAEILGDEESHFHLSALMCPEHRSQVLARVRQRLAENAECRVVSTQLIEAGVDIDFPVVYRALAGLDAIAQAAGRCNRNGRMVEGGRVFLFKSAHQRSEAFLRGTMNAAEQLLPLYKDPLSLDAIEHYFKLYYWDQSDRWDQKEIVDEFRLVNDRSLPFLFGFARVARNFEIITSGGREVIVPWGSRGAELYENLVKAGERPGLQLLRQLQRFTVQIPFRTWQEHLGKTIGLVLERYPILTNSQANYSERFGLTLESSQMPFLEV